MPPGSCTTSVAQCNDGNDGIHGSAYEGRAGLDSRPVRSGPRPAMRWSLSGKSPNLQESCAPARLPA